SPFGRNTRRPGPGLHCLRLALSEWQKHDRTTAHRAQGATASTVRPPDFRLRFSDHVVGNGPCFRETGAMTGEIDTPSLSPVRAPLYHQSRKSAAAGDCLAALGNPTRLKISRLLAHSAEGMPVGRLQARLDTAPSTLSHHLKALIEADLVHQTR